MSLLGAAESFASLQTSPSPPPPSGSSSGATNPLPDDEASTAVPIVVRGKLDLEVQAERRTGKVVVRGSVRDELGLPVRALIEVHGPRVSSLQIEPCTAQPSDDPPDPLDVDEPEMMTNAGGRFCLETNIPTEHIARFSVRAATQHYAPVEKPVALKAASSPRIVRAPASVRLGSNESLVAEVIAGQSLQGQTTLKLQARCGDQTIDLGRQKVAPSQRALFEFSPDAFQQPNRCHFAAMAGSGKSSRSSAAHPFLVQGTVELTVAEERTSSDEQVLTVQVGGYGARAKAGLVEVRQRGAFVASIPVENGRAVVHLAREKEERQVQLAYRPASEIWRAGKPLDVGIPAREITPYSTGLHALALVGFFSWLVYAWVGRRRKRPAKPEVQPAGGPVLQNQGRSEGPISGLVVDAHTGAPIAGAQVRISAPTPEDDNIVETVDSDDEGRFSLETRVESAPLLRALVTSPITMPLEARVQRNQLVVQVTERRRAAVQALLHWVRGRSGFKRAPTPGEVEFAAETRGDQERATWARAVAEAAYGPEYPEEKTIDQLSND